MLRFDDTGEAILVCQKCGGWCTHADAALIGMRDSAHGEDGDGSYVLVDNLGRIEVRSATDKELSGRRHSISLLIWCEECGARTEIRFVQHKGSTYVEVDPGISPVSETSTESAAPRFTIR